MERLIKIKGLLMVMFSAVLYGLMPTLARFSYAEGVNVVSLLFYRYIFAFLMLLIYILFRRINIKISYKQFIPIFIAAVVGTVFTTYSLFISYDYISTGLASTLHFIYPALTSLFAFFIYHERFGKNKFAALIISLIGISLLTLHGEVAINIKGICWALVSGLFYAIYIICAANKELRKLSPYVVAFYVFTISFVLFFIIGISTNTLQLEISSKAIFYIGNLSFLATFVAVILFFVGMQQIGPSSAAILSTFEPLTGVLLGLVVFHEKLSLNMLIGCLLVFLSVIIVSKDKMVTKKERVG